LPKDNLAIHFVQVKSIPDLYNLVCAKKIPYYKSQGGKLTYFDKSEVEAWQLQCRVKPTYEIEQEAANYNVTGKHSGEGGKNV
jgi:predicted DNA-binding transcriptional regulator AlpA